MTQYVVKGTLANGVTHSLFFDYTPEDDARTVNHYARRYGKYSNVTLDSARSICFHDQFIALYDANAPDDGNGDFCYIAADFYENGTRVAFVSAVDYTCVTFCDESDAAAIEAEDKLEREHEMGRFMPSALAYANEHFPTIA